MDTRPFDLKKIDTETIRLQKRKKLLLWSLPGLVLLVLMGLWLVVPSALTLRASQEFQSGSYDSAAKDVAPLTMLNLIEKYKAFYNQGTTLSAKREQETAVGKFETALAYTSDRDAICVITYNLVLTMEGIGDTAVKKVDPAGAITQYTKALNRLKANKDCFPDPALQKRIEEKIKAVEDARRKQGGKDGDKQDSDQQPSESQQEKIKENEEKANVERREDQNNQNNSNEYKPLPAGVKPW